MTTPNSEAIDDTGLSIDEMLASGDPALVDYAKSMQGDTPASESAVEDDATQGVEYEEDDEIDPEEDDDADEQDAAPESSAATPEQPHIDGVIAKDGKNYMPYSVVEQARENERVAREQARDLQAKIDAQNEEAQKLQRQLALAAEKGVELPTLPEDEEITDEMIAEMEDVGPEFAIMARKLRAMQESMASKATQRDTAQQQADNAMQEQRHTTSPEYAQAQQAVSRNPAIQEILSNPALKNIAVGIENTLLSDEQYASLDARYAEVVKRVGGAMGIDFAAKYGPAVIGQQSTSRAPNQDPATPESLSDIPNADATTGKTSEELLAGQTDQQLIDSMEGMSQAQLQAILGG